jgi:hypothetical protein
MKSAVLFPSLAVVLLCYGLSVQAQTSMWDGGRRSDAQIPSKSQLTHLSGKVVADDGGEIQNAEITVRCEGEAVQVAHPDTDGVFRFALGGETSSGIADTSMSNSPTMRVIPKNNSFACEVRVSASGIRL